MLNKRNEKTTICQFLQQKTIITQRKNNIFLLCRQKSAIYNDTEQNIELNKITI